MSSGAARMVPERSTELESVETAANVGPTESEIAAVAYQLWLNNGCPVGSGQEDWFRAEAMLRNALGAQRKGLPGHPSIPGCDTRAERVLQIEFRWEGHWEAWEMEWGGARWIWDSGCSRR